MTFNDQAKWQFKLDQLDSKINVLKVCRGFRTFFFFSFFFFSRILKLLQKIVTLSVTPLHYKSLKTSRKTFDNRFTNKNFMPKNDFE